MGFEEKDFMKCHVILFVNDQQKSMEFYKHVLQQEPILNVPGMTEFALTSDCILGLMPVLGAKKILSSAVFLNASGNKNNFPKSEVYLRLENPQNYYERAIALGAISISPMAERNWGATAGYVTDIDGHLIAFST